MNIEGNGKFLLVIIGPTAVGKTDLCLKLAKKFESEIISCDSRQFFKEMNLGTAKPNETELLSIKHHFIDNLSIHQGYDVKTYEKEVLELLEEKFKSKDVMIMTGGSGLYVDAICKGFDDIPDIDPTIRASLIKLFEIEGIGVLQEKLKAVDPLYYTQVDLNNPQRLMRALEVYEGTGKPFSSFRIRKKVTRPFGIFKVGLTRNRDELYQRIDQRMDEMIEKGLFEEAASLYPFKDLNALQTVGYTEIFGYLAGEYDKEEAIRLLKRNSRRYAKRQMTWFKRDEEITWFEPSQFDEIISYVKDQMAL
ncbi:tRNA (adenosine(37)-N6)-dimethylallyltransferase MiaA [Belliella sp. DSM 111904]|uniref:tRNA dimethylallyltransferase n=1 Tax=Belliella filtrata TaxID=2923435 RepID=A0ABS9UWT7_9BACT|nr:tRNA (adenosine(37)-N6)-dimethylallyltransferase MiaA [Belliella filtrata]MCH7408627.1 tRNA (adenosine(37)-N6)-dimethylallyltransferase MiaA [Belliella filtrata]